MHFSDRIKPGLAVVMAALVFFLSACGAPSDLFAYTKGPVQFSLIFPSVSGDTDTVVCDCTRDENGGVVLTVAGPARLAGFTVTCASGTVCAGYGDVTIPLSPEAAEGLTRIFTLLTEEGSAKRSADGAYTIITAPSGTVTLGEEMMPVEAEIDGRIVGIRWGGQREDQR